MNSLLLAGVVHSRLNFSRFQMKPMFVHDGSEEFWSSKWLYYKIYHDVNISSILHSFREFPQDFSHPSERGEANFLALA